MRERYAAFLVYVDDWLSSASRAVMSLAEQGAYWNLLCRAWQSEDCGLPSDDVSLSRLSEMGSEWTKSKDKILVCFELREGRFYNARLLRERENQLKIRSQRKSASEKRWSNDAKRHAKQMRGRMRDAYGDPCKTDQAQAQAQAQAQTDFSLAESACSEEARNLLAEYLATYPKKTKQDAAARAYVSQVEGVEGEHDKLMAGLARHLACDQWVRSLREDAGRFIPDPDRFIVKRLYLDQPAPYQDAALALMGEGEDEPL